MGFIGKGDGNTLVILTDAESRHLRKLLEFAAAPTFAQDWQQALLNFNCGIARGTAKLQEEAAANQKAKREGKSK